jgi:GNAT superfamily N-acetyltransferase
VRQDALVRVERLTDVQDAEVEGALADVLVDCVVGGASVGFVMPFGYDEARQWWREALREPDGVTWIARLDDARVVGVVRLMLVTKPNGKHRAEVAKLLVHRDARGQGCAASLMSALEAGARKLGRTVLTLDTQTGSVAETLYERRGWHRVGVINDYAANPDGRLAPTTFMAKYL